MEAEPSAHANEIRCNEASGGAAGPPAVMLLNRSVDLQLSGQLFSLSRFRPRKEFSKDLHRGSSGAQLEQRENAVNGEEIEKKTPHLTPTALQHNHS